MQSKQFKKILKIPINKNSNSLGVKNISMHGRSSSVKYLIFISRVKENRETNLTAYD